MVISDIVANALATVRKVNGVNIIYRRGSSYVRLNARIGRSDFGSTDVKAVIVEFRTRDYCVAACDLVIDDQQIEPERGDEIDEKIGDNVYTYVVGSPGGDQAFRYSDSGPNRNTDTCKVKGWLMSTVINIADSLVNLLTAQPALSEATVERVYIPIYNTAKETGLKVFVLPLTVSSDNGSTRGMVSYRPNVTVCVMKHVNRATQIADVDNLIDLVEQLAITLNGVRLTADGSTVQSVNFDPLYDPELLDGKDTFQSVLTVEVKTFLSKE